MAYYLKGIGDFATKRNEITPQFDAKILNFIAVNTNFVADLRDYNFEINVVSRGVTIGPGMACSHGYFGLSDTTLQFNFITPSTSTQYAKIYAEFDLGTTPQEFSIKATQQSNSSSIDLVQDDLSVNPTGKYQMELCLVTLQTSGTVKITDRRTLKKSIGEIESSLVAKNVVYDEHDGTYSQIKYDSSIKNIYTKLRGPDGEVETKIPGKVLVWESPASYGIGTSVPSDNYLEIEFNDKSLYGGASMYEVVFDYETSLPDNLIKIPKKEGSSSYYSGGRIHAFVDLFTSPSGQPNILAYPLGTLTNWENGDQCGTGSALLMCPTYQITGKKGMFFQYIERRGNTNVGYGGTCSLIKIYAIYQ